MRARHRQFFADLTFVLTLILAVYGPIVGLRALSLGRGLPAPGSVSSPGLALGALAFGPMLGPLLAGQADADFLTLCGWPVLSWGMLALALHLRLDLGPRAGAWAAWLVIALRGALLTALAGSYLGASTALTLMGPSLMATLGAMIALRLSPRARAMDAEAISASVMAEQLLWPWLLMR